MTEKRPGGVFPFACRSYFDIHPWPFLLKPYVSFSGWLKTAQERWGISVHFLDDFILAEEFVASMLSKYHAYRWLEENGYERCLIEGDI
jgi:hypothetical protein